MGQGSARTKIRYEVDPHNRLVVSVPPRQSGVPRFRKVLDGEFVTGPRNSLTYHIKKSAGYPIPQQVKFSGDWSLDEGHNLVFVLDKWSNQCEGNRLAIKGEIASVGGDELVFSVATRDSSANRRFYLLRLAGAWQADARNRLSFRVERERASPDILTLSGSWEVDRNNQITYSYTRRCGRRRQRTGKGIIFKGYWDVSRRNRISYVLNSALHSGFDFQARFLRSQGKSLLYGLCVSGVPSKKTVSLQGEWRFDANRGLVLEMGYGGGRVQETVFSGTCRPGEGRSVETRLKSASGEDLGVTLRFSRKFLAGQGEAFAETLSSGKALAFSAGAGIRW